jgi:hypothetical protein
MFGGAAAATGMLSQSANEIQRQMRMSPSWEREHRLNTPRGPMRAGAHLDQHLKLLLDNEKTRYILTMDTPTYHQISPYIYCTDAFLTHFLAALLHPSTQGASNRVMQRLQEKSGMMAPLLPQFHTLVQSIREAVISHGVVVDALDVCRRSADVTVLAIDGQFGTLMSVVGQPKHGEKYDLVRDRDGELHAMLTITCTDGVLHIEPFFSEHFIYQLKAILNALRPIGTTKTRMINSDSPVVLDQPELYEELSELECVSADLIHPALRIEKASGEKPTKLSLCLRRYLQKLRMGLADGHEYYRCGMDVPRHTTIREQLAKQSTIASTRRFARCSKAGYEKKPYNDIDEFVADVATLVRKFPQQMQRKASKKTTIKASLINSTSAQSLEYLANFGRFVSRNPAIKIHDSTSNEAYHRELKGMFRNVRQCTPDYARTHAKVASAVKVVVGHMKKSGRTPSTRIEMLVGPLIVKLLDSADIGHELCQLVSVNCLLNLWCVFRRFSVKFVVSHLQGLTKQSFTSK